MSILHFTILNHWFFVGLKLQHWFIGYTLNPLAGHSLVHCIGTSHWKPTLVTHIGSHWIGTINIGTTVVLKRPLFHIGSDIGVIKY